MRTHTEVIDTEVIDTEAEQIIAMRQAFAAIEKAVWFRKDHDLEKGPDRLMATALINKVWEQLEE